MDMIEAEMGLDNMKENSPNSSSGMSGVTQWPGLEIRI